MPEPIASNVLWNLDDLYAGFDDPRIETDRKHCTDEATALSVAYKGRLKDLDPLELLTLLRRHEDLSQQVQKLHAFAYLSFSTQTNRPEASALWQATQEFASSIRRETLFFELEWNQLEEEAAQRLMEDPSLEPYRHHLRSLRRYRPHLLSEPEERILAEREPAGQSAWSTLFDKVLSHMKFGQSRRTQSEVLSQLYSPDRETRRQASLELTSGLEEVVHIVAHVFNTILLDKAIDDRLRHYPHWLRARNLANEADDSMVEALVQAVRSRYDLVARYYRLKGRLLGIDQLYDYDRYAPLPAIASHTIEWQYARKQVLGAFEGFSPKVASIAGEFFESRWIHAPVLPGKRGGAFAHPTVPSHHPYILLNYTGKHRDVMTLAHELGHGVHQVLAGKQGLFNSSTPLTTAETASVFGEMLVFRHLLGQIEDPIERMGLICGKLEDTFATVFRQVSMNRFEETVHNERRSLGELSCDRFSRIWIATQQEMFGDSVELLDHYRLWWAYIQHFIHWPGYVYAYAFGELLTLSLYKKYEEEGPSFTSRYIELLESGGRATPQELLSPFGIDLGDPQFWRMGLEIIERLLDEATNLAHSSPL